STRRAMRQAAPGPVMVVRPESHDCPRGSDPPLSHTRHSGNDKATIGGISARVEASGPSICSAGVAAHPGSLPTNRERTPTMGTIIALIIVSGLAARIAYIFMRQQLRMALI